MRMPKLLAALLLAALAAVTVGGCSSTPEPVNWSTGGGPADPS